jgi:hypothetical protein
MLMPDMERFLDEELPAKHLLVQWWFPVVFILLRFETQKPTWWADPYQPVGKDVVHVNECAAEGTQLQVIGQDEYWCTIAADIVSTVTEWEGTAWRLVRVIDISESTLANETTFIDKRFGRWTGTNNSKRKELVKFGSLCDYHSGWLKLSEQVDIPDKRHWLNVDNELWREVEI